MIKPPTVKNFIKSVYVCSTHGPSFMLDMRFLTPGRYFFNEELASKDVVIPEKKVKLSTRKKHALRGSEKGATEKNATEKTVPKKNATEKGASEKDATKKTVPMKDTTEKTTSNKDAPKMDEKSTEKPKTETKGTNEAAPKKNHSRARKTE